MSGLLLSACVSNPSTNKDLANASTAGKPLTTSATTPAIGSSPVVQKKGETPDVKVAAQTNASGNALLLVADKRTESTGLLGKTLVAKKKYSKSWHGELEYFNNFAKFYASGGQALPVNTKVLALVPDKRIKGKEFFAFVKEDRNSTYFVDTLEIDVPKGFVVSFEECTFGSIGLFKESNTSSENFNKPLKAWSVVNGRFSLMTNTAKMECRKPFDD
jgi:hypothetical protein